MKSIPDSHYHDIIKKIDMFLISNWYNVETLQDLDSARLYTVKLIKQYYGNTNELRLDWLEDFPQWSQMFKTDNKNNVVYFFDFWMIFNALDKNDLIGALLMMHFYFYKIEQSMILKFFKRGVLKPEFLKMAMEELSKKHLFVKNNGIGNTIKSLSYEIIMKNIDGLKNREFSSIFKVFTDSRNRFKQSFKSLAVRYYALVLYAEEKSESFEKPLLKYESQIKSYIDIIIEYIHKGSIFENGLKDTQRIISTRNAYIRLIIEEIKNTEYESELRSLLLAIFILYKDDTSTMAKPDGWKKIFKAMQAKRVSDLRHIRFNSKQIIFTIVQNNEKIRNIYNNYSNAMKFKLELSIPVYLYFLIRMFYLQ